MYCIYHSIDLDGWCSAAIVKKWCKEKEIDLKLFGWNYGDEFPNIPENEKIVMVDVSFPIEIMEKYAKGSGWQFIWIDHHKSAIDDYKKFIGDGESFCINYLDNKFAACELTWDYCFPKEPMPEFVRLLGRYDCFRHKGTNEEQKVLEFQYAARANISNVDECYKWLEKSIKESFLTDRMISSGKEIYKYLCTEAKQSYKNGFPIEFVELIENNITTVRKFICVNKERFNPINFGINYHKDGYDGAACFHYANGTYNFSLYNDNGKADCSIIAKSLGGGGHKGAAGFRISAENINKIIKNERSSNNYIE